MKWVEKHTFLAHGVALGVEELVVLEVVDVEVNVVDVEVGVVDVDIEVGVVKVVDVVVGGVGVTKHEQADEIEDAVLEHWSATSVLVVP